MERVFGVTVLFSNLNLLDSPLTSGFIRVLTLLLSVCSLYKSLNLLRNRLLLRVAEEAPSILVPLKTTFKDPPPLVISSLCLPLPESSVTASLSGWMMMSKQRWKRWASRTEHILEDLHSWRNSGIGNNARRRKPCMEVLFLTCILMFARLNNKGYTTLPLHMFVIWVLSNNRMILHNVLPTGIFSCGKQSVYGTHEDSVLTAHL